MKRCVRFFQPQVRVHPALAYPRRLLTAIVLPAARLVSAQRKEQKPRAFSHGASRSKHTAQEGLPRPETPAGLGSGVRLTAFLRPVDVDDVESVASAQVGELRKHFAIVVGPARRSHDRFADDNDRWPILTHNTVVHARLQTVRRMAVNGHRVPDSKTCFRAGSQTAEEKGPQPLTGAVFHE
jgi:hypothetical protein